VRWFEVEEYMVTGLEKLWVGGCAAWKADHRQQSRAAACLEAANDNGRGRDPSIDRQAGSRHQDEVTVGLYRPAGNFPAGACAGFV